MALNTFFNNPYYPLMEFGFFVSIGMTAGSLGLI